MDLHLRQNAVAYLALAIALTTGTAYAADQVANGSVTSKKLAKNSVTSPKIKKSAVKSGDVKDGALTGADVKDGSLTKADLAAGVLPDGTFVTTSNFPGIIPAPTPDGATLTSRAFSAPAAGTAYVRLFLDVVGGNCSGGSSASGALYLDGVVMDAAGSSLGQTSAPRVLDVVATGPVTAGPHTVALRLDCGAQNPGGSLVGNGSWTVMVAPS